MASDQVHVQLAHDVAQRADVEFLHARFGAQQLRDLVEFGEQQALLAAIQVDPFGRARHARNQQQPSAAYLVRQLALDSEVPLGEFPPAQTRVLAMGQLELP